MTSTSNITHYRNHILKNMQRHSPSRSLYTTAKLHFHIQHTLRISQMLLCRFSRYDIDKRLVHNLQETLLPMPLVPFPVQVSGTAPARLYNTAQRSD